MLRTDFHFDLPPHLIAQHPAPRRDASRLFLLDRRSGTCTHRQFAEFPGLLRPGDLLCVNDTRVLPARLRAVKAASGGQVELLLLEEVASNEWWVLLRPGRRVPAGTPLRLVRPDRTPTDYGATVLAKNEEGHCRVRFEGVKDIRDALEEIGEIPLPPYIERNGPATGAEDRERYQTVYAAHRGSVAAPTAGLHFTPEVLERIRSRGIGIVTVTLHVGAGTFAPMKADRLGEHVMHEERYQVSEETAEAIRLTKARGDRVVAVGTTTCRVLETAARNSTGGDGLPGAGSGRTRLFLYPPAEFRVVDAMLTNFHLPESTLLMLVSAFASPGRIDGRDRMLSAYAEAVREGYRFFSYGDAMFIE